MASRSRSTTRRTDGEILFVILSALKKQPSGPTNLMYKANISWRALNRKFIPPLLTLKLLITKEVKGDDKRTTSIYLLTERGETIANACRKYKIVMFALAKLIMGTAGKRRTKMEIIINIMSATKEKSLKTPLMGLTRMSWKPLSRCLEILLRGNLVMMLGKKDERPHYQVTETGLELIQLYENAILYVTHIMRQEGLDEPIGRHMAFYNQL